MSDYSNPDKYYRWQVTAIDSDGYDLMSRRDFASKREGKAYAKALATEPRSYFRQHAESDTFPDEIEAIALFDREDLEEEFTPQFKA